MNIIFSTILIINKLDTYKHKEEITNYAISVQYCTIYHVNDKYDACNVWSRVLCNDFVCNIVPHDRDRPRHLCWIR